MDKVIEIIITILVSTGIVGGLVTVYFNKRLENYKHELNLITENARYNFQRKIQDFSLYTVEKHKRYIELHKLILNAHGRIFELSGRVSSLDLKEFGKSDIEIYLEDRNLLRKKRLELLSLWDKDTSNNKETAISEINQYCRALDIGGARDELTEARNYYLKSRLYLSTTADASIKDFLDKLSKRLGYMEFPDGNAGEEIRSLQNEISVKLDEIVMQMKEELSIGYYESDIPG